MKHSQPETLERLDRAWDPELGALGKLRDGVYDADLAQEYISLLESIEIGEGEAIHADFVRLLWFAPIFAEWQAGRVEEISNEKDATEAKNFANKILDRVMQILGTP